MLISVDVLQPVAPDPTRRAFAYMPRASGDAMLMWVRLTEWRIAFGLALALAFSIGRAYEPRCDLACSKAVARGDSYANQGRPLEALRTLDDADASCDCMRLTSGDEPPEYSAARRWLTQHEERGNASAVFDGFVPRGPILRSLLRRDGDLPDR